MKTLLPSPDLTPCPTAPLPAFECALVADWRNFLFVHFPNRLSTWAGPRVYGLPYRYGVFDHDVRAREGVARLAVEDPRVDGSLALVYPLGRQADETCEPGTAAAFLLERYRAYTFRGTVRRRFDVAHEPWRVATVDWVRTNTALITAVFPWFAAATFHSAQVSPGVTAVEMGWPHRVEEEAA